MKFLEHPLVWTLATLLCLLGSETVSASHPTFFQRTRAAEAAQLEYGYNATSASGQGLSKRWTNAERMARGISPKPPTRRFSHVPRTIPSGSPSTVVEGYIRLINPNYPNANYYVGRTISGLGALKLLGTASDTSARLIVRFDTAVLSQVGYWNLEQLNLDITNPSSRPWLGFEEASTGQPDLTTTNNYYVALVGSAVTTAAYPPVQVSTTLTDKGSTFPYKTETPAWHYDPTTQSFDVGWTRSDGNKLTSYFGLVPGSNSLGLTYNPSGAMGFAGTMTFYNLKFEQIS